VLEPVQTSPAPAHLSRRLTSGVGWATGGRLVALPTGLAVNVLLARLLSPSDLGAYFVILSLVTLLALASELGLNQAIVRGVAEAMARRQPGEAVAVVRSALGLTAAASGATAVILLVFGHAIGHHVFGSTAIAGATIWIALLVPVTAFRLLVPEAFRGFGDIKWATITGDAATNVALVLGLAVVMAGGWATSLTDVLLLSIALSAVLLVLTHLRLRRTLTPFGVPAASATRRLLRISLPLLATNLSWTLMVQIDTLVLGAFRSERDVAYYVAGSRLAALLVVPLMIGNSVIAPLITELWTDHRMRDLERLVRGTSTLTGLASGLGFIGLVALAPQLLETLFGSSYQQGATVLVVLAVGSFLNSVSGACGLTLMMAGEQVAAMLITIFVTIVTVAASIVAADAFGAIGVASVMAAGVTLQNVLNITVVRLRLGIWTYPDFELRRVGELITQLGRLARSLR